jgi:hypothetical protein
VFILLILTNDIIHRVDDPLIWGTLPFRTILNRDRVRWTLGAQEICFKTPYVIKKTKYSCLHSVI